MIDDDTSTGEALEATAEGALNVELTTLGLVVIAALAELASLKRACETELGITDWGLVVCRSIGAAGRRIGLEVVDEVERRIGVEVDAGLIFKVAALLAIDVEMGGEAMDRAGAGDVNRDAEVL